MVKKKKGFSHESYKQNFWKTRGQTNLRDKRIVTSLAAIDVENSAISLPKLENCVQFQLGDYRHWRHGVIIIIYKPLLTLGWKSRADRCIFDSIYLLLNAHFESTMFNNRYLRCLFGHKMVIVEILRSSFIGSLSSGVVIYKNVKLPLCWC